MKKTTKILLVATKGGHLTQGLKLFSDLPDIDLIVLSEDSSRTRSMQNTYTYKSKNSITGKLLGSFLKTIKMIIKERPKWIISTGAECGVGAIFAALLLFRKTMFIETACRCRSKSKSARITYPFVKVFLVQHEESLKLFGKKAQYIGGIF